MYYEQRDYPRNYEEGGGGYGGGGSTRGRANAGLTLGIIGTALGAAALWRNGGSLLNGGGNCSGGGGSISGGTPANVNINSFGGSGGGHHAPTAFEAYEHECEDVLALTNAFYGQRINSLQEARAARDTDVAEKFSLYKSQVDADFGLYVNNRDNIDRVNNRINNELFSLYKYTRDKDDETNARLSKLESAVAVNAAVRPYQDKLIQCEIDKAFGASINYTDRKTCKMLEGIVTLPLEPTVTGAISQTCCNRFLQSTAG
ncbi:MAG: hypothetical protein J6V12_04075 [Bacteroidaceae bacterium]|nr:hypothetical protein [Bacteroidaceae bacterium]